MLHANDHIDIVLHSASTYDEGRYYFLFFLIPFNVLEGSALCRRDAYNGEVATGEGGVRVELSKYSLPEQE